MYAGERSTPWISLARHFRASANERFPVPQPTSSTHSPSAVPANSRNGSASRALQRPISNSYPSPLDETNVDDTTIGPPHPSTRRDHPPLRLTVGSKTQHIFALPP